MEYGAEQARLIDCRTQLAHEGVRLCKLAPFPHLYWRATYFNHPTGSCGDRHHAGGGHEGR